MKLRFEVLGGRKWLTEVDSERGRGAALLRITVEGVALGVQTRFLAGISTSPWPHFRAEDGAHKTEAMLSLRSQFYAHSRYYNLLASSRSDDSSVT